METKLDIDWVYLMTLAKEIGLTKDDVRVYFEKEKKKEKQTNGAAAIQVR
ncbi:anti-repressor SinI family protein [Camelliibacillus cellulosilyticus]|uniref:Anti-repressor SinI family protein n=1 Tax=Camelliibacillus cellulosilyticus TaxID=2174486 RepID=A0ABV9GPU4_9BACL